MTKMNNFTLFTLTLNFGASFIPMIATELSSRFPNILPSLAEWVVLLDQYFHCHLLKLNAVHTQFDAKESNHFIYLTITFFRPVHIIELRVGRGNQMGGGEDND